MADRRLQRVFRSLDAAFEAAADREERLAAADLALSFRQGAPLREVLGSHGAEIRVRGRTLGRVTEVGRDYLASGNVYVAFDRAVLTLLPAAPPPRRSELDLVAVLRALARSGRSTIELETAVGREQGVLTAAAPDHIEILGAGDRRLVPFGSIAWLRTSPGGSVDAP